MAIDYYDTLGVKRNVGAKEIQSAYRRLARKYHPDVTGGDKAAEERFKTINEANEVLGDEVKRAAYDKWGDRWQHAEQLEEMGAAARVLARRWRPRRRAFQLRRRRRRLRERRVRTGGLPRYRRGQLRWRLRPGSSAAAAPWTPARRVPGTRAGPSKGEELRHQVTVSLAEAFSGSSRTVQVQTPESCPSCGGSGRVGAVGCHDCQGNGRKPVGKRLEVTIPVGVETGTKIRLRGKGGQGRAGGPPGDVVLEIVVADDPRFERRGASLHTDVAVPLTTALLGGEVSVGTPTGELILRVPEGTQNGRVFRLGGKGMPVMKSETTGDLFAKVRVVLPEQIDDERRGAVPASARSRVRPRAGDGVPRSGGPRTSRWHRWTVTFERASRHAGRPTARSRCT